MASRNLILSILGIFILSACGLQLGLDLANQSKGRKALLVATTDYRTGALAKLDLSSRKKLLNFSPIFKDAVVRVFEQIEDLFVINRLGADNIQKISPLNGITIEQTSLGLGSNPQDMVIDGEYAYVSFLQRDYLRKIKINDWTLVNDVDLKRFSDSDGFPEASLLRKKGRRLWIQLQKLNQVLNFTPEGNPEILILDMDQDEIVKTIPLLAANPVTPFKDDRDGNWLLGEAGVVSSQIKLDGGIEKFDPNLEISLGVVITEEVLEGDIVDFECVRSDLCVAIISKPETELISFNPQTGKKTGILWKSDGYHLRQILWDRNEDILYVADGNPVDPKIRVWSSSGEIEEKTDSNWGLSLPPYQMVLVGQ